MSSFDDTVTETIKKIIRNVFDNGETAEVIFQFLDESDSKTPDERTQIFVDALSKILGEGCFIIEDLILETLYSKYGLDLVRQKDYKFTDYIIELRKINGREKNK